MPKFTPQLIAAVGHRYLFSDDTLEEIAAAFNINQRDITRMRVQEGWPGRYARIRRVPRIPEGFEAPAQTPSILAQQGEPSRDCLRQSGPLVINDADGLPLAALAAGEAMDPPPRGSLIDRIERLVEQELAAEERLRAELSASPRRRVDAQRCAR